MNEEIKRILRKALGDVDFEKIILFGSRARGDSSEMSDYDILITVKDNIAIKEKMKLAALLRRKLAREGVDADIIIKSKDEVDYYKEKIGSVVRSAIKEGVAI